MAYNNNHIFVKSTYYIIEIDKNKNRLFLTLMEYWCDKAETEDFIKDIQQAMNELSKDFTLMVDLSHYKGTSQELQYLHFEAQKITIQYGVNRIAEIHPKNPVIKMFSVIYSNETGAKTMSFSSKDHAQRWLDLY